MGHQLVEMERRARALRDAGDLKGAIELFSAIVERQPDWEHGMCYYEIAGCYEDLGEIAKAEPFYRKALIFDPENEIYMGGLASFLYLHGRPQDAFDSYLELMRRYALHGMEARIEKAKPALMTLGEKLGMTHDQVMSRVQEAISTIRH